MPEDWSFSSISSLKHFPFFIFYLFYFSQKAINITSILLQNLIKEPPDEINILVATHELELFAIKYGKTHLTAKERAIVPQELFGEFGALFDESFFAYSVEY